MLLFADAVFNILAGVFLMSQIVFNVFSMMFAKTSLLLCCFWIRLFVTNYVCVVPYGVIRNLNAIIRAPMVLSVRIMCVLIRELNRYVWRK